MFFACNELAGCPASWQQLASWAAELGSDAPFFLIWFSVLHRTGREVLDQPFDADRVLKAGATWIAKPTFGISTPQAYQACRPELLEKRDPLTVLGEFLQGRPQFFNDLEQPVFQICPGLAGIKSALQAAGFSSVMMTGSGSAFICQGLGQPPQIDGLSFTPIRPRQRQSQGWYTNPRVIYAEKKAD